MKEFIVIVSNNCSNILQGFTVFLSHLVSVSWQCNLEILSAQFTGLSELVTKLLTLFIDTVRNYFLPPSEKRYLIQFKINVK